MTHQRATATLAAERYLLDEMSEIERMAFEAHYFDCPQCAADVRAGELMRAGTMTQDAAAQAAPSEFVAPAPVALRPAGQPRWQRTFVPWAAAAAIALFAGYQSLFVVPALRRAIAPQALDAVTLRPASRGAEPVVHIRPGERAVLFALDVNATASGPEIEYELQMDNGSSRFTDRARTPAPGSPLLLLMPVQRLASGQRFAIVVRDPARPESPLGEYRFVVASDGQS